MKHLKAGLSGRETALTEGLRIPLRTMSTAVAFAMAFSASLALAPDAASATEAPIALVDGKLPVLDDGFPAGPITLWCAQKQGHPDDVFNTIVMDIASQYSPVPITKKCRASAPTYGYTLIDFIKQQPRGDDGAYHPIWTQFNGVYIKPWTVESMCGTPANKIEPILSMAAAPYLFVVSADSEYQTLEDLIAYFKANPGTNIATTKPGSGAHAIMSLMIKAAGVDVNFVPTEGSGETKSVLLGGGAQFGNLVFGPGITDGLRVLAVSGDTRAPALPDVPTAMELGYDVPGGSYWGIAVDKDTPQAHRDWLVSLLLNVANDPKWKERNPSVVLINDSAEASAKKVEAYVDALLPILNDSGLLPCPYANEPVDVLGDG